MKDIKITIIKVLSVLFVITLVALLASIAENRQLQGDLDRQTSNVSALTYDIKSLMSLVSVRCSCSSSETLACSAVFCATGRESFSLSYLIS